MSPLESLAPDQRAVLALVLQQGRSYDEIAALLAMPVAVVRARAQAGLASLARDNGLPEEITAPLADYLLGQQQPPDADATRGLLAESAAARSWAADVAAGLEDVAPRGLPEIPDGDAAPRASAAAKPRLSEAAKPPLSEAAKPASSAAAKPASPAAAKPASPAAAKPASPAAAKPASPAAAKPASSAAATPAGAPAPSPRPRPVRESSPPASADSPPAASRLGGVVLIAVVLAVVAVVLFVVLSGGDDPGDEQAASSSSPAASATPTPTPTATPQVADSIPLRSTTGGNAKGTMTLFLQDGQLLFALEAQDVPPSGGRATYAVWFTGPGAKARRLGFTNPVGNDGRLGIQGPSEKDLEQFPQLYATHERVVVSRETSENAKRPTRVILSGRLPQGR